MGTTEAGTRTDLPEERTESGSPWAWKLRVLALVLGFAAIAWAERIETITPEASSSAPGATDLVSITSEARESRWPDIT